jgi:hypothetical protein
MIQDAGWKGGQHLMALFAGLRSGTSSSTRASASKKAPADNGNGIGRLFHFAQQQFMR